MHRKFLRRRSVTWAVALLLVATNLGLAQTGGSVSVQLPTFHQFGVSTTVVVPDQGSLYLGGVSRSRRGNSQYGTSDPGIGARVGGTSSSSGSVSVNATIIDHNEIDRALLAEAARRRGDDFDIYGRWIDQAPRLSPKVVGQRAAVRERDFHDRMKPRHFRADGESPMPVRAESNKTAANNYRLAATYLERARKAEAQGQPQMAKIFYQRVVKHGSSANRKHAKTRLAAIETNSQR